MNGEWAILMRNIISIFCRVWCGHFKNYSKNICQAAQLFVPTLIQQELLENLLKQPNNKTNKISQREIEITMKVILNKINSSLEEKLEVAQGKTHKMIATGF